MDPIIGKALESAASLAVEKVVDIQVQRDMAIMLQQQESIRLGEITSREVVQREALLEREANAVEEMQARLDREGTPIDYSHGDSSLDASHAVSLLEDKARESGVLTDGVMNRSDLGEAFTATENQIYQKAGVDLSTPVVEQLAGKSIETFRNGNILAELATPDGSTNLDRMKDGLAPYVEIDGRLVKVELHHHRQINDGPLVELDEVYHRSNRAELHPNQGKGEGRGDDPFWSQRVSEHWRQRANEFHPQA